MAEKKTTQKPAPGKKPGSGGNPTPVGKAEGKGGGGSKK
jgi:hypothetical protein